MHGVYYPSRPRHFGFVREYLPFIGFALLPLAGLLIATAVQAGGVPTLPALTMVLTMVGTALGQP